MAVPKSTTRATEVTSSSSSDSMTPSTAAAAAAPQIEKPPAMSRVCERLRPSSRPTTTPPAMPSTTTATTTPMTPHPSRSTSPSASWSPSSATPRRSSRLDATARPGSRRGLSQPALASAAPTTMATRSGLSAGTHWLRPRAAADIPAPTARPGRARVAPAEGGAEVSACCGLTEVDMMTSLPSQLALR